MELISRKLNEIDFELAVLLLLKQGDSFGYELSYKIKQIVNEETKWSKSTIYPILKEMEKEGMICSYWVIEDNIRARKYYSIKEKGKAYLEAKNAETELTEQEIVRTLSLNDFS
jgi:PadR family transcriptional regulator, regulatory protein PadR